MTWARARAAARWTGEEPGEAPQLGGCLVRVWGFRKRAVDEVRKVEELSREELNESGI
jgi:hypothetical protein